MSDDVRNSKNFTATGSNGCSAKNRNQSQNQSQQDQIAHDLVCICCPIGCALHVEEVATTAAAATPNANVANAVHAAREFIVTGNKCPRGKKYAIAEMIAPMRTLTSTVKIVGAFYPVISVKTAAPIPKEKIFAVMDVLSDIEVKAPLRVGDVVVKNVAGTGVDVVATKNLPEFSSDYEGYPKNLDCS